MGVQTRHARDHSGRIDLADTFGQIAEQSAIAQVAVFVGLTFGGGFANTNILGLGGRALSADTGFADCALVAVVTSAQLVFGDQLALTGFRLALVASTNGVVHTRARDNGFGVDLADFFGLIAK